jgi:predicted N-acetyltransferase YhbS
MTIRSLALTEVANAVPLMAELGYPTTAVELAQRLQAVLGNPGDTVLVAEEGGVLLGLVALHSFAMLHRPGRLGRITALIVAARARGRGIGGQLIEAAENHLLSAGCTKLEVTSAVQRHNAHGFYAAHGYSEQRVRFTKEPVSRGAASFPMQHIQ